MRIGWRSALFGLVGLAILGMVFAWSGLFNVAASSGHWLATDWLLHWTMRNSVRTHALGIEEPPALDDAALLPAAAGHYASGCAGCHGAPGEPRSPVVRQMAPAPPALAADTGGFEAKELFWIVRHGVKFTGMPAWPAQARQDEVWAMVAFLKVLPQMSEERYRELAFGGAEATPALTDSTQDFDAALADCARCHDRDGSGRSPHIPIIAGQKATYLQASLRAYAAGTRHSGFMQKAAFEAEPELFAALAEHFAAQGAASGVAEGAAPDGKLLARGRAIAERGVPAAGVPACNVCHGAGGKAIFPRLAGQHRAYLSEQLRLFRDGTRGGTAYAHIMRAVAKKLSDQDIAALAAWFAAQPPDKRQARR